MSLPVSSLKRKLSTLYGETGSECVSAAMDIKRESNPKQPRVSTPVTLVDNWMEYAELLYRCQLCISIPCILTSQSNFLRHIQTRHFTARDTTQKCPECELNFETPVDLQTHTDSKHASVIFSNVIGNMDDDTTREISNQNLQHSNVDTDTESFGSYIVGSPTLPLHRICDRIQNKSTCNSNHTSCTQDDKLNGYHSDKNSGTSSIEQISDDDDQSELTFQKDYDRHARLVREGGNIVYLCSICRVKKPSYNHFTRHLLSGGHKRRANAKICSKRLFNGYHVSSPTLDSDVSDSVDSIDYFPKQTNLNYIDTRTELQKTLDLILAQSCQTTVPTCVVPLNNDIPVKRMGRPPKRDQSMLFPYQVSGTTPIDLSFKQSNNMARNMYCKSRNYRNYQSVNPIFPQSNGVAKLENYNVCVSKDNKGIYYNEASINSDFNMNIDYTSNRGNKSFLTGLLSHDRSSSVISSKYVSRMNDMSNNLTTTTESKIGLYDDIQSDKCLVDMVNNECSNEPNSCLNKDNHITANTNTGSCMKLRELLVEDFGKFGEPFPKLDKHSLTSEQDLRKDLCKVLGRDFVGSVGSLSDDSDTVSTGLKHNVDSSVMFTSETVSQGCDKCGRIFSNHEQHTTHLLTCPAALYNMALPDGDRNEIHGEHLGIVHKT